MEYVDTYLHLGHVISNNLDDENDIIRAQGQFVGQVNNVLCYFRQLDCFVKYRLSRSFCTAFYGCELWHLRNRKLLDFGRMWNKSIRRIWNLPYNAHCSMLPLLCQCLPVFEEFCCRFIKIFAEMCHP